MEDPPGLAEWAEAHVPECIREDPIWRLPAYRFALYLGDLVQREDAPLIQRDYRTRKHVDQLLHAIGSVSANISEGYGSTTGPERAKFYEYAQRSAREARDWIFKVRHALPAAVASSRMALATRIMKILTVAITRERAEPETRARKANREGRSKHSSENVDPPASASDQHEPPATSSQ
jgi:four helix bundle protein